MPDYNLQIHRLTYSVVHIPYTNHNRYTFKDFVGVGVYVNY